MHTVSVLSLFEVNDLLFFFIIELLCMAVVVNI